MYKKYDNLPPIFPKSRKRMRPLVALNIMTIISQRPPLLYGESRFEPTDESSEEFVEKFRKFGEAVDKKLDHFALYYGENIQPRLDEMRAEAEQVYTRMKKEMKKSIFTFIKKNL